MKNSKIDWLLEYVNNLNISYKSILANTKFDFSEDKIKIFFHKKRMSHFLMGEDWKIVPITFEVWPSLSCDARCPLCTYSLNHARKEADKLENLILANTDDYQKLFAKFRVAGVNSLIFTGGGEPTLHPDLPRMTKAAFDNELGWGMFTHGLQLTEKTVHNLLASNPRFLRISINSGSHEGHKQEYRIGLHTYDKVRENAIMAAKISNEYKRCIGLGYALNGKISIEELEGIASFIIDVFEKSGGGLKSIAFRPKVHYYNSKGEPVKKQPFVTELAELPQRIEAHITSRVKKITGNELKIDLKTGMFDRLVKSEPANTIASNWTGSIDHLGTGYLLSELNGSPWQNSSYGNFVNTDDFFDVWNGIERLRLSNEIENGQILAPAHHKISHIDDALKEIRNSIGTLTKAEINEFYTLFENKNFNKPSNWDFL